MWNTSSNTSVQLSNERRLSSGKPQQKITYGIVFNNFRILYFSLHILFIIHLKKKTRQKPYSCCRTSKKIKQNKLKNKVRALYIQLLSCYIYIQTKNIKVIWLKHKFYFSVEAVFWKHNFLHFSFL